jgi:hypothetical protein
MPELNKMNNNRKVQLLGLLDALLPIITLISLLLGVIYLFGGKGIAGAVQIALAIGVFYGLGNRRMEPILLTRESSG